MPGPYVAHERVLAAGEDVQLQVRQPRRVQRRPYLHQRVGGNLFEALRPLARKQGCVALTGLGSGPITLARAGRV